MKRMFGLITVVWFCVSLSLITGYAYASFRQKNDHKEAFLVMENLLLPDVEKVVTRLTLEDVFVNQVLQKQELITMEVELSEEVEWNDSWTDDWFQKKQRIKFFSTGKYSTNLNDMTAEDIRYDHDNQIIHLSIQKPEISSIEIDELKTLIEKTENGLFRFGEIALTSAEHNQILALAKNQMRQEMQADKLMTEAEDNTIRSVTDLYTDFLTFSGFGMYQIATDWK